MSENIEATTETVTDETEQVVVEARVNKSTLQVAAIASVAGAAVAGLGAYLLSRRSDDSSETDGYVVFMEPDELPETE